jgi:hypothetical protein
MATIREILGHLPAVSRKVFTESPFRKESDALRLRKFKILADQSSHANCRNVKSFLLAPVKRPQKVTIVAIPQFYSLAA